MNNIEQSRVQEIITLHNEIAGYLKTSLEKAIRIGGLLSEQKSSLKHGEFTSWMKANLPFTDRSAQNYMRLHRERNRLKTETVSDLKSAYKLLTAPKPESDIERLRRELDELELIEDWELGLKECKRIRDEAFELTQKYAEDVLRTERKLGKLLIDIKNNLSNWDKTKEWCDDWIYIFDLRDSGNLFNTEFGKLLISEGYKSLEDFLTNNGLGDIIDNEQLIRSLPEEYKELRAAALL